MNVYDWPLWAQITAGSVLGVCIILGLPLAHYAGKRRGRRLAHPELFTTRRERAKDTSLFLAALIPTLLVWLSVMGVSFIGLTGFAADMMRWDHWTNILVPLSLDGISVSFGAWAFVAVKRGRHPGRAYKIIMFAATMSSVLNFVHGRSEWSIWAGAYLAFLSFAGMAMFHELLDQFMAQLDEEALEGSRRRTPRWGWQRWFWAPMQTVAANRAWAVYPPPAEMRPTPANALFHLSRTPKMFGSKPRKMTTIVYTEADLELVPDKPRTGSQNRPEPVLEPVQNRHTEPYGDHRNGSGTNGRPVPHLVDPYGNGFNGRNQNGHGGSRHGSGTGSGAGSGFGSRTGREPIPGVVLDKPTDAEIRLKMHDILRESPAISTDDMSKELKNRLSTEKLRSRQTILAWMRETKEQLGIKK